MKGMGVIVEAMRNPVEGIIGIFSTGLFAYAVYLLSPWYEANYTATITAGLQNEAELALAIFFILSALPGLVAPFIRPARRERSLKLATMGVFLSFLFLFILRIVLFGLIPWTWLPLLMISLVSAYLHIWLKVRKE